MLRAVSTSRSPGLLPPDDGGGISAIAAVTGSASRVLMASTRVTISAPALSPLVTAMATVSPQTPRRTCPVPLALLLNPSVPVAATPASLSGIPTTASGRVSLAQMAARAMRCAWEP
ncbi:MAG: hypothetical protein ACR5LG_12150 [Sodalis sp. (in: enterobacteria)]